MRLIIYFASHDPAARANYKSLLEQREDALGDDMVYQHIHGSTSGTVLFANPEAPNVFENLPLTNRNNTKIELIAHGDGSRWIKSMPQGEWKYKAGESNTYKDINAENLKAFFVKYTSEEGRYKFSELTLFCCNGYKFGKELALLMPEIKITCFKEYIQIDKLDGMAYPFTVVKENNEKIIKPIDKNGEIITKPEQIHYRAAQWILKGNTEETLYASANAIPNHISQNITADDSKPVAIRGNIYNPPPHPEVKSSQEKSNDRTNLEPNILNMQEPPNPNSLSENETLSTRPKMR